MRRNVKEKGNKMRHTLGSLDKLSSSEKNKTIKQFQRTERAFMKVLGKAHEG